MFLIWFFAPAKRVPAALVRGERVRARRQRLAGRSIDLRASWVRSGRLSSRVERGPLSSSLTALTGSAWAWAIAMEYFFEMPSEKRSA